MDELVINNLSRSYRRAGTVIAAVDGLNHHFKSGEMTVIHGSSGSGKSTLLLMLGGMMKPTSGSVHFNGENICSMKGTKKRAFRNRKVGFIFQKFYLLPYLSVRQNIVLPLHLGGADALRPDSLNDLLERFQLSHRLNHRPGELSVGEQQRVALIRSLIKDPALILADEPTGNLDPENLTIVARALREEAVKGRIVILVTHNTPLFSIGDCSLHLENGRFIS
ncbi:MAG: ABC transporter ATP-binding protein [bacterium]